LTLVLLSADGPLSVYAVPDIVAENLHEYCLEFCNEWIHTSEHAQKLLHPSGCVCYDEKDFVDYLNAWIFPDDPSVLIETLPADDTQPDVPEKYSDLEWFNF